MSFDKLPVASGEMRIGKIGAPRTVGKDNKKVLDLWLVQNSQKRNPQDANDWIKDKELWIRMSLWEKQAENVYASIKVGDFVQVTFEFWMDQFKKQDGSTVFYIEARPLLPLALSTRFRYMPHHGGGQAQEPQDNNSQPQGETQPPAAKSPAAAAEGGYNPDEEPPF